MTTAEKQQWQREARLVVDLLQNSHYSGRAFREMDSNTMIARFLSELDPKADLFIAENIEAIHRRFDRTLKSVYLFRGDLQPAFEIFEQFRQLARSRLNWAQQRLDRGFDFETSESYEDLPRVSPFKTLAEADHHWELKLKEMVLIERLRGRTADAATAEIKRRFTEFDRSLASVDPLIVRERFFDAIIRSYDPHSGYFSSDSAREFSVEMEKAVVGLGLDLKKEKGRCVISAVQAGGTADLNSTLAPGDLIEALAEGNGPWKDIAGLRLRQIVGMIRGSAGTAVRLAYRPGGTEPRREVTLERSRIVLGADRAHGAVSGLTGASGGTRRIGWIELPSFYAAGENGAVTSAARDVRELLQQMTVVPLDGLVIDLRGNPGGAVNEAAALSEVFLPRGNLMVSRGLDGVLKEHPLQEGVPAFAGPLVVLVAANSASASEVFAGAMKYHRRAVIVGARATFGKGTMQNYIDVSKIAGKEANDWGTLRLTMERFYLPDGHSVQRTGILADIAFPYLEPPGTTEREADLPGAMPEEIVPTPAGVNPTAPPPNTVSEPLISRLAEVAATDFKNLPEWALFTEEQTLWKNSIAHDTRSLVYTERNQRWVDQRTAQERARRTRRALAQNVAFPTEPFEIKAVQSARETHEARLRAVDGGPPLRQLRDGAFLVETDRGHLRKLRLDAIDFQNYSGDTEGLATAFSGASGHPVNVEAIGRLLQELSLLEHRNDAAVLAAAGKLTGEKPVEDASRRGTEALLSRLTEIDHELILERPALDVPLRESLRLAAAWADRPPTADQK